MNKRIKFDENNQFFLSISDLIMGILLIFVLLYVKEISTLAPQKIEILKIENKKLTKENSLLKNKLKDKLKKITKIAEENSLLKDKLKNFKKIIKENTLLKNKIIEITKVIKEYEKENKDLTEKNNIIIELKNKIVTLEKKEATIEELHQRINNKLLEAFKDEKDIKIDTINQELVLDDSVLFGINEWQLKEVGRSKLHKILPKFFATFLDDETVINFLEQLTIEGHTDDLGSKDPQRNYLYNLDLSQKRAYEVARFIYSDPYLINTLGEERLKKLKIYLSSNGKSNANLIYKDFKKNLIDRNKSRRVTIKYRLDIQKMLKNSSGDN